MSTEIPYFFDLHLEADERLQDATLFYHLDKGLDGRMVPCSIHSSPLPDGAWGLDRLGVFHGRREMARSAYEHAGVLSALEGSIMPAARVAQQVAESPAQGFTIRNLKDPVHRLRHMPLVEDVEAHLRTIGVTSEDPVVIYPDYDLRHLRRFMVVAGQITCESPMLAEMHLANIEDEDFADLQVDRTRTCFIDGDLSWWKAQREAAEALLAAYSLPCGAIDVGLYKEGDEMRARVESVTAAPPGGVFPYMADMERHAAKIIEHVDELAPAMSEDMTPLSASFMSKT